MTETRTPYQALGQFDLFGTLQAPQDLDRDGKVAYILERWPECRGDDKQLAIRFWQVFDGLEEALGPEAFEAFRAWFCAPSTTNYETIRRGRAGIQQLRTGTGALLPGAAEIERRRSLDGAGPPRNTRGRLPRRRS